MSQLRAPLELAECDEVAIFSDDDFEDTFSFKSEPNPLAPSSSSAAVPSRKRVFQSDPLEIEELPSRPTIPYMRKTITYAEKYFENRQKKPPAENYFENRPKPPARPPPPVIITKVPYTKPTKYTSLNICRNNEYARQPGTALVGVFPRDPPARPPPVTNHVYRKSNIKEHSGTAQMNTKSNMYRVKSYTGPTTSAKVWRINLENPNSANVIYRACNIPTSRPSTSVRVGECSEEKLDNKELKVEEPESNPELPPEVEQIFVDMRAKIDIFAEKLKDGSGSLTSEERAIYNQKLENLTKMLVLNSQKTDRMRPQRRYVPKWIKNPNFQK